jgi:hypothetical protein
MCMSVYLPSVQRQCRGVAVQERQIIQGECVSEVHELLPYIGVTVILNGVTIVSQ